jgi:hypothetical protein
MIRGDVRADGSSAVAERAGVYDMAALADGTPLSPELEAKMQALYKTLDGKETLARFKLELFLKGGPRRGIPVRGVLCFFTNGGYLHGGGDAAVYLCPQEIDDIAGGGSHPCLNPLDMQFSGPQGTVCTKCRRISDNKKLIGQVIAELPLERWAQSLTKFFHILECSADLRVCVERRSITQAANEETERYRGGERYAKVYAEREWITYPLASIVKDTASGATLERRIKAFLEA